MKNSILKILKQSDDFISGEKLSDNLNVSRTAIWKNINSLKEQGYEIESITRKGYKLKSSPDKLNEQEILEGLKTKECGKNIIYYDVIDSTNRQAKIVAMDGACHGTIVVAEQQQKGKGRRGKCWSSPYGEGIWISMILRSNIEPSSASMITLVAGLAVCNVVKEITTLDAKIKWPNDIVVNGKKVSGILTEISTEISKIDYLVVGIGLNVNTVEFDEEISSIATSLKNEANKSFSRKQLLQNILFEFERLYEIFLKTEDLTELIEDYKKCSINIGKYVKVISGNDVLVGKVENIDKEGQLVIITDNNERHVIISGEVSVRGLYGYV